MRRFMLAAFAVLLIAPAARAHEPATPDPRVSALSRALATSSGHLVTHEALETGAYDFVRASSGRLLATDNGEGSPIARALAYLSRDGALIGMSAAERRDPARVLRFNRVDTDMAGRRHVRFDQVYRGLPVFGAQVVVHLTDGGVSAVNGSFLPTAGLTTKPQNDSRAAAQTALALVRKTASGALEIGSEELSVFRTGLVEGQPGRTFLTWSVIVEGAGVREQVFVDAISGRAIQSIPLINGARDRVAYSPQYDRSNPEMYSWRKEGQPPSNIPPVDRLYDFTGEVYDFFAKSFGRDSFDGRGKTMRTVYLINQVCPNAYWNSSTTNYCPGFDVDDVVAHEWAHAYTEHTHGLIYACQSGALNESYSDIFGETIDLLNGSDGIGGSNNAQPYPEGQRWLIGEDLAQAAQEQVTEATGVASILRDMWDPARAGSPGRTSESNYICDINTDHGGVHSNSGVPNHAYAMLVDGKTYNGVTIRGIGFAKAAHIYFQAMKAYQTPATKFATHEQSLLASCDDLSGINLPELFTGAKSGKVLGADDCRQVQAAAKAVQLSNPLKQCKFTPLLEGKAPGVCPGSTTIFSEDWEKGMHGWTKATHGANPEWSKTQWDITSRIPKGHKGHAAFALDPNVGSCETGDDNSGSFNIDSPAFKIPANAPNVKLRFDHWVATERGADGGNVMVSVNDGDFTAIPAASYVYNKPNLALSAASVSVGGSNKGNPKGGQAGWSGADGGETTGTWGTSIADLAAIAKPGDTVRLRLDFGVDCASGYFGWYVDNIRVYSCPVLPAPEIKPIDVGSPIGKPLTIEWSRPTSATGPDTIQESAICAPLVNDDAENGLAQWDVTTDGVGAVDWQTSDKKPAHEGNAFWGSALEGASRTSSFLTLKNPLALPGPSTLTFNDWFFNESDDFVAVEVSTNGTAWEPAYKVSRSDYVPFALASFVEEGLTARTVDLSPYTGKTIHLRFRFATGADDKAGSTPFGWYVDDISLTTDAWHDVATVPGTSYTIASHKAGTGCFRVSTTYTIHGERARSPFGEASAAATFTKFGVTQVKGKRVMRGSLPSTGLEDTTLPGVSLAVLAFGIASVVRRRRART